MANITK